MTTTPTFADLGVPASICDALARRDIHAPFDIQTATLEDALAGRDVLGRAPTGSGKTIAFGIPTVVDLPRAKPHRPTALILAPTRELADQIQVELSSFSKPSAYVATVGGGLWPGKNQSRKSGAAAGLIMASPRAAMSPIGKSDELPERNHNKSALKACGCSQ